MGLQVRCANHPTEAALTRCGSCSRRLCGACWLNDVDDAPWCEACVFDLQTSTRNRTALAVLMVVLTLVVVVVGYRADTAGGAHPLLELWATVLIGGLGGAVYLAVSEGRRAHGRKVERRDEHAEPAVGPERRVGNPYRTRLRRVARVVAPPLSGSWTVVVLLACMVVTAVALPLGLGASRLVEAELVLGAWWLTWTVALTVLLYRGWRLSDDFVLRAPRLPFGESAVGASKSGGGERTSAKSQRAKNKGAQSKRAKKKGERSEGCRDASGCADLGGSGGVLVGLVVVALIFVASWLVVELVLPFAFFLVYLAVRGALSRVANDDHDCEGDVVRSLGWGTLWSSIYALPLAVLLGLVHAGIVLLSR